MDPYEHHKKVYNIMDRSHFLRSAMAQFSKVIDDTNSLPNSLQAMLGMIYRYEGKTQSELAEIYQRDEKNLIHYVTDLVKRGYVYKVQEGQKKKLFLTESGQTINDILMQRRGALIEKILAQIPEENLRITEETLDVILNVICHETE